MDAHVDKLRACACVCACVLMEHQSTTNHTGMCGDVNLFLGRDEDDLPVAEISVRLWWCVCGGVFEVVCLL